VCPIFPSHFPKVGQYGENVFLESGAIWREVINRCIQYRQSAMYNLFPDRKIYIL